jgi:cobalt/nickel transport system permease protein
MNLTATADLLALDELARQDLPLQRMDARVKLVVTLAFIVTVMSFPRYDISALAPLFLFPAAMFALGGLPFKRLVRPLLAAAPFAVLVGLANPLLDRAPLEVGGGLILARGWFSFASILVRFGLAVSAAFALTASTGMHRLCGSLAGLGVPQALAVQVWLLYRYLFVLAEEAGRLIRSVRVRSADRPRLGPSLAARLTGVLLLRAMARAERIHQAMLARGFDGRFRLEQPPAVRVRDLAAALAWLAFFAAARTWNLADALGRLIAPGVP